MLLVGGLVSSEVWYLWLLERPEPIAPGELHWVVVSSRSEAGARSQAEAIRGTELPGSWLRDAVVKGTRPSKIGVSGIVRVEGYWPGRW